MKDERFAEKEIWLPAQSVIDVWFHGQRQSTAASRTMATGSCKLKKLRVLTAQQYQRTNFRDLAGTYMSSSLTSTLKVASTA